jgi:hypothetical protein
MTTFRATGLPPGLAIHRDNGNISGTVAPGASAGSPYHVTVLSEGPGRTLSRAFIWHVHPPGPPEPADLGGGAPTAIPPVRFGPRADGSLTYSARGLPPGLSISSTGAAGAVLSLSWGGADETALGDGPSVVLADLGDQTHRECDSVELAAGEKQIVFRAIGLQEGLSINSSTGLISGPLSFDGGPDGPAE